MKVLRAVVDSIPETNYRNVDADVTVKFTDSSNSVVRVEWRGETMISLKAFLDIMAGLDG